MINYPCTSWSSKDDWLHDLSWELLPSRWQSEPSIGGLHLSWQQRERASKKPTRQKKARGTINSWTCLHSLNCLGLEFCRTSWNPSAKIFQYRPRVGQQRAPFTQDEVIESMRFPQACQHVLVGQVSPHDLEWTRPWHGIRWTTCFICRLAACLWKSIVLSYLIFPMKLYIGIYSLLYLHSRSDPWIFDKTICQLEFSMASGQNWSTRGSGQSSSLP